MPVLSDVNALDPDYAALLADDAYTVKQEATRRLFIRAHKYEFDVGEELSGKTGALIFLKSEHTMGVCAFGINHGKGIRNFAGHAFVILKGTASGFDALTDLNAGVRRASTGGMVHQGFFYTFDSFLPQLKEFQKELSTRNIHTIHCIGHSLGGALATMAADWLSACCSSTIKLYTFGSPRVGFPLFAETFTRRVKAENIFRVYHKTDPVPMVPTWPFIHVPEKGTDYLLDSGLALLPWKYHMMEHYKSSTKPGDTAVDWRTLAAKRPPEMMDSAIEQWLKSDGPISLTLNTANVLGKALLWVLEKIVNVTGIALVGAGCTTFTILDRLAYIMHKAFNLMKDLGFWVLRLIKRMAQLLGIVVTETTDLTVAFMRVIFIRLHHGVSELVRKASSVII